MGRGFGRKLLSKVHNYSEIQETVCARPSATASMYVTSSSQFEDFTTLLTASWECLGLGYLSISSLLSNPFAPHLADRSKLTTFPLASSAHSAMAGFRVDFLVHHNLDLKERDM